MFWNWLFRWVLLGPVTRLYFRIKVVGKKNLPRRGPYVMAIGPHRTQVESVIVASYLRRRQLHFFAKQEYWDRHKFVGRLMTLVQLVPLDRQARKAMVQQVNFSVELLGKNKVVAMYPEATRGFDEFMHRGYVGVARIAIRAGVPIIPVGLRGMRPFEPPGKFLRPGRGEIHIGEPIYPFAVLPEAEQRKAAERLLEATTSRALVTQVCREIAHLADVEYLDQDLKVPGDA